MYIDSGGYGRRRIITPGQQTADDERDMDRTPHAYESFPGFAILASPKLPRSTPRASCKRMTMRVASEDTLIVRFSSTSLRGSTNSNSTTLRSTPRWSNTCALRLPVKNTPNEPEI